MLKFIRMIFCRHKWDQRYWGGSSESGYLCLKCGRIQYRKCAGGPPPPGVSFGPTVGKSAASTRPRALEQHVHTEKCWEPDSGCDMGRNADHAVAVKPSEALSSNERCSPCSEKASD
jgi:hypothetical protein